MIKKVASKVREELIEYGMNVVYLTLVFGAFTWYRRLLLAAHDVAETNYFFALIQALVLAKVIMTGRVLRLGRGLDAKPLIFPTLYKTVVFVVLVAVFKFVEHGVSGLWHGVGFWAAIEEWLTKAGYEFPANCLVVFAALLPFFAVKELSRVLGHERLWGLFFRPRESP